MCLPDHVEVLVQLGGIGQELRCKLFELREFVLFAAKFLELSVKEMLNKYLLPR